MGHTAMAVGMAYMYLPKIFKSVSNMASAIVFGLIAAVILLWLLRTWSHASSANALWLLLLFDTISMAYMFVPPSVRLGWLSYVLALYFLLEAVGWTAGTFDDEGRYQRSLIGPASTRAKKQTASLAGETGPGIRFSLAAMSLGMAYMFLAMQIHR